MSYPSEHTDYDYALAVKDRDELQEQLEEALSIIDDFTEEYGASEKTWERIQVLELKQ